jgi:hypothetical protein
MGENIEPRGDRSNPHLGEYEPPPDRGHITPTTPSPSTADLERLQGPGAGSPSVRALEDYTRSGPRHPNQPGRSQQARVRRW